MSRRSPADLEADFERHLRILEALTVDLMEGLPPEVAPALSAQRIRAKLGLSAAIRGIKQAINDFLDPLQYASKEEARRINERLARAGAPRLEELLAAQAKTVRRILKQRQLNTEVEYYLVKEVVVNVASSLTADQRQLAEAMLDRFERGAPGAV